MFSLSQRNIYFYPCSVHMMKSFEGLSGIVERNFPGELLSGSCFVFLNRKKDKMKILVFEGDGFSIYYKRLEKGRFLISKNGETSLTRREFMMMFEGVKPKYKERRFNIKKE